MEGTAADGREVAVGLEEVVVAVEVAEEAAVPVAGAQADDRH